jgi:hypothetical protein
MPPLSGGESERLREREGGREGGKEREREREREREKLCATRRRRRRSWRQSTTFYNLSRATVHEVGVCPLEAVAYANLDTQGLPLVCVSKTKNPQKSARQSRHARPASGVCI